MKKFENLDYQFNTLVKSLSDQPYHLDLISCENNFNFLIYFLDLMNFIFLHFNFLLLYLFLLIHDFLIVNLIIKIILSRIKQHLEFLLVLSTIQMKYYDLLQKLQPSFISFYLLIFKSIYSFSYVTQIINRLNMILSSLMVLLYPSYNYS